MRHVSFHYGMIVGGHRRVACDGTVSGAVSSRTPPVAQFLRAFYVVTGSLGVTTDSKQFFFPRLVRVNTVVQ